MCTTYLSTEKRGIVKKVFLLPITYLNERQSKTKYTTFAKDATEFETQAFRDFYFLLFYTEKML